MSFARNLRLQGVIKKLTAQRDELLAQADDQHQAIQRLARACEAAMSFVTYYADLEIGESTIATRLVPVLKEAIVEADELRGAALAKAKGEQT